MRRARRWPATRPTCASCSSVMARSPTSWKRRSIGSDSTTASCCCSTATRVRASSLSSTCSPCRRAMRPAPPSLRWRPSAPEHRSCSPTWWATADAVEDGTSGFIVPVDAPEALADRVVRLLDDAALRQRFSAAATDRLSQRFDIRSAAARLRDVYLQAARCPRRAGSRSAGRHPYIRGGHPLIRSR